MRIRITSEGIDDLAIGTEFTLSNVPPASWAGKYIVVDNASNVTVANKSIDTLTFADVNVGAEVPDVDEKPRRNRKDAE